MEDEKAGSLRTGRYMEFAKPETIEYFKWLDNFSNGMFEAIFSYEWNKVLLLFGKGEENYVSNLTTEEMEEIYGGD